MGHPHNYQWKNGSRIETRDVANPCLYDKNEVDEPMPDIRQDVKRRRQDELERFKKVQEAMQNAKVEMPLCSPGAVDEPMFDIREEAKRVREEGTIGESGAEAFFCDTTSCVKQKNEVLKLSGMRCHDDILHDLFVSECEKYKNMHDRIASIREDAAEKEKLLEALAMKMGYESVSFADYGVRVKILSVTQTFPPVYDNRGRRIENYEGWDA